MRGVVSRVVRGVVSRPVSKVVGGGAGSSSEPGTAPSVDGDIISVTVNPDGWSADVTIKGWAAHIGDVAYDFGLGANNAPGINTPYLNVTSEGFNSAGVLGTILRRVYMQFPVRQTLPNYTDLNEVADGDDLVIRVALSEFVYDDDKNGGAGTSGTDPVFFIPAGWANNGTDDNAAILDGIATNNSAEDYPVAMANWTRPDRFKLSTASVTLGAIGFHASGRNGLPLACIKFTATDASLNSVSEEVAAPTIDSGYGDAKSVTEYISTLDLSTLTEDELVTCNFVAYPFFGDENSVYDASAEAALEQHYILDTDDSRGYPMAAVDPVNGDDSTGVIYDSDTEGNRTLAASNAFATMYRALYSMRSYNNSNNGRNGAGESFIYLMDGSHPVMGGSNIYMPYMEGESWTEFRPMPGHDSVLMVPAASATNRYVRVPYALFRDLTFERDSDAYWGREVSGNRILYINCSFEDTRASNTYILLDYNFSRSDFIQCSFSKIRVGARLNRGCTFTQGYDMGQTTILGIDYTHDPLWTGHIIRGASTAAGEVAGAIIAYNSFLGLTQPLYTAYSYEGDYEQGKAFVGNVVDAGDTGGQPLFRMSADGTISSTNHNLLIQNSFLGQRCNLFYNDDGSGVSTPHRNAVVRGNAMEYFANKGDLFSGAAVTGNFAVLHGVYTRANRMNRGAFYQDFRGLDSVGGTDSVPLTDYLFEADEITPAAGSTFVSALPEDLSMIPYDLNGNAIPNDGTAEVGAIQIV